MRDNRVAKRYANALFAVAKKANEADSVGSDLELITSAISDNPKFQQFLFSPVIEGDDKLKLMDSVFSDRVTATTFNLLRLVLEKKRETNLPGIQAEFEELRREANRAVAVVIQTAFEASDAQQKELIKKAEQLSGKHVSATFEVDPQLIGGVRLLFDNVIYDGTLKGQLQKLEGRLSYDLTHESN